MLFTILSAADALGRFDHHALSDQQLIELMFADLTPEAKAQFLDANGDFLNVCSWNGVSCSEDDEFVILIQFNFFVSIEGSVNFRYVPPSASYVEIRLQTIPGTLEVATLPPKLRSLILVNNKLYGTINFAQLPCNLIEFDIAGNEFTGECNLTALPETLQVLKANNNRLGGSLALNCLPSDLIDLDLSENMFVGEIELNSLPKGMQSLFLSMNQLYGTLSFGQMPKRMKKLSFEENDFRGEVSFEELPPEMQSIFIGKNALSGDFILKSPPASLECINAGHNNFSGVAVVPTRFNGIEQSIVLERNQVERVVDENGTVHPHEDRILRSPFD